MTEPTDQTQPELAPTRAEFDQLAMRLQDLETRWLLSDQRTTRDLGDAKAKVEELDQRMSDRDAGAFSDPTEPTEPPPSSIGVNSAVIYRGTAALVTNVFEGGALELLVAGETKVRAEAGEWSLTP